jgi:hypothetical protein
MSIRVYVETFTLDGAGIAGQSGMPRLEATKMIDHSNSSDRKWLTNHSFWAMRNARKVSITPVESN